MRLLRERPRNEAAANTGIPGGSEFSVEPLAISIAAADQAKPARIGHGSCEPAPRRSGHRRGDDWMLDAELPSKSRLHRSLRLGSARQANEPLNFVAQDRVEHLLQPALAIIQA